MTLYEKEAWVSFKKVVIVIKLLGNKKHPEYFCIKQVKEVDEYESSLFEESFTLINFREVWEIFLKGANSISNRTSNLWKRLPGSLEH